MNVLWLRECVQRTLAGQPWTVLLEFKRSDDEEADWSLLWPSLMVLEDSKQIGTLIGDLRGHGLGVVVCGSEQEARRLVDGIYPLPVGVQVLNDEGRWVFWARPEPRRLRKGGRACRI